MTCLALSPPGALPAYRCELPSPHPKTTHSALDGEVTWGKAPVTITLRLDIEGATRALRGAAAAMESLGRSLQQSARANQAAVERLARNLQRAATPPPARVAGLEARYYVRGGLDPAYASPAARDAYCRHLALAGRPSYAAAFLRGWVEHHPAAVA